MMNGRNNGKKLMAVRIVQHAFEIIHLVTELNPIQVLVDAIVNTGPREDSTRIGSQGTVRRQAVDVSPLRRVNQAISLLTIGVSFRFHPSSITVLRLRSDAASLEKSDFTCILSFLGGGCNFMLPPDSHLALRWELSMRELIRTIMRVTMRHQTDIILNRPVNQRSTTLNQFPSASPTNSSTPPRGHPTLTPSRRRTSWRESPNLTVNFWVGLGSLVMSWWLDW